MSTWCQRRIAAELDALQPEADAVKRLQAETAAEFASIFLAILVKPDRAGWSPDKGAAGIESPSPVPRPSWV